MAKFPVKKYASLEMNRAGYLKNGLVVSQLPLCDEFTAEAPCENGMWLDANKANGELRPAADLNATFGIVYTTEKEWRNDRGLMHHCSVAGEYPRVGVMQPGDTFTTNCFDMGEVSEEELKALEAPLYLAPEAGKALPKLVKELPAEGFYAQVIKYTTMPNGEPAIKYNVVRV